MTTYTDPFGGDTIPPSQDSYRSIALAASKTLAWPHQYVASSGNELVADILEVSASVGSLTLTLPEADIVSVGEDILFRNTGANSFEVLDSVGGSIVVIAAGAAALVYITSNATAAGTWSTFTYGTGTSAADASALAGNGFVASSGKLTTKYTYTEKNTNYTALTTDRSKFINFTANATLTLPAAATAGDGWSVMVRNGGAGVVTIDPSGAETIDGLTTKNFQPDESALLLCNGGEWHTIGYGRDLAFAFSEIILDSAAGSAALSASDVSGRMIRVSGTAAANVQYTLPGIDNIYFVTTEAGLGAFTATFTTGSGSTVVLSASARTAIYCDGTNVLPAITTALTSELSLDDGSAGSPTLKYALDLTTGLFRPGASQLGFALGGSQVVLFDATQSEFTSQVLLPSGGTGSQAITVTEAAALATAAQAAAEATASGALGSHTSDLANPHVVTKTQVGLSNVDNTSDANKPVSTAQDAADNLRALKAGDTFTGTVVFVDIESAGVAVAGAGTMSENRRNLIANSSAGLTFNLPAAPANGDRVHAIPNGTNNHWIIGRNGNNIMGLAEDMTVDNPYAPVTLEYLSSGTNWVFSTGL